jgi:hypothetical protein
VDAIARSERDGGAVRRQPVRRRLVDGVDRLRNLDPVGQIGADDRVVVPATVLLAVELLGLGTGLLDGEGRKSIGFRGAVLTVLVNGSCAWRRS